MKKNDAGVPFLGETRVSTETYKKNYDKIFSAQCHFCFKTDKKSNMMNGNEGRDNEVWFHVECLEKSRNE